ncbi:TetR/AcrR family transcriptional regulator [Candidimonas nitroreducens]|uniref:HTH tetR-type domain-containing protein n=1 Tax=Candidimonas nitroreducens TaxID=683354 RepID=A0A225MRP4_9BURK|nr:TetR/AcrR family transcriptional regulator [Candidimonas nitroreducens]OWT63905.1 hypothetical protein CEY11_06270 [Candidimonas nitroreducens]
MLKMSHESDDGRTEPPLTIREKGKLRRRNRIKEAARIVFREMGYEAATTREIAERAEVSQGTLFAYASTKSELLFMIVNDDIALQKLREFSDWPPETRLMYMLMHFSIRTFQYWARDPEISRQARVEVSAVLLGRYSGPEALKFAAGKPHRIEMLTDAIRQRQAAGRLRADIKPDLVAELWWCIYNQHLRNWLNTNKMNLRQGMERLHELYQLAFEGFAIDPLELVSDISLSSDLDQLT